MKSSPLVSVVIPTYNRADLVCGAVESALAQTYANVEVIVVDDGSTDDTHVRLQSYGSRIRVLHQPNGGPAKARNTGIKASTGEVIAFLDSDDIWLAEKLERQVSALDRAGASAPCCLSNARLRFVDGRELTSFDLSLLKTDHEEGIWVNVAEVLATRFVLFNQAVAVRRSVLDRIGGFNPVFPPLEDYELALRLSLEGPWAFIRDPMVVWHGGSPGSLSGAIHKRNVASLLVGIREAVLLSMQERGTPRRVQELLNGELNRARRELRAFDLGQREAWPVAVLGHVLAKIEQYRQSVFRRMPGFPRMLTQALP
jgi:glycosyltransferase involved in cell wall biosynthesis